MGRQNNSKLSGGDMRTVSDILQTKGSEVYTINETKTVFDALMVMDEHQIGSLMVIKAGKLVGMVTERDYASKVIIKGKQSKSTPIEEIMTKNLVVAKCDTTINECMALMTDRHIRHLPVIENENLVGLVSIGDVVKEIIDEQNFVIEQLESYIQS
jgi:CBS domain-containing protein